MRRLLVLLPTVLLCSVLGPAPAAPEPASPTAAARDRSAAQQVLDEATALLTGSTGVGARASVAPPRDASLVLRDLRVALPRLDPADRRAARALLARPTDGRADPEAQGYTTRSVRRCDQHVCVHFVRSTGDRAAGTYVDTALEVMERVWTLEVGKLGYRAPVSDGPLRRSENGGNGRFDVYLADLGASSLYGYCSPEFVLRSEPRRAGGYCVLDNDFSQAEYGAPPAESLAVTAAHEFFHAIQFGYDYREDRWFLESSATWIEERFADDVDDNRQYLSYGQVEEPATSLDLFDRSGFTHYGNWVFWEHLTERYDVGIVRKVWNAAQGSTYSLPALASVLRSRGGLVKRYADFAAGNLTPGQSYREGADWRSGARPQASWTLSEADPARSGSVKVDHLAAASYLLTPDASLTGSGWRLTLDVDAPSAGSSPAAWLVVRTVEGEWTSQQVPLDAQGRAAVEVGFSVDEVRAVSITLANVSTRYRCGQGQAQWACEGTPRDQDKEFALDATLSRRS